MHISFLTRQIRLDSYMVIRNYICREIAVMHYETFQNTPNIALFFAQLETKLLFD